MHAVDRDDGHENHPQDASRQPGVGDGDGHRQDTDADVALQQVDDGLGVPGKHCTVTVGPIEGSSNHLGLSYSKWLD